jgi:hypothetical protein
MPITAFHSAPGQPKALPMARTTASKYWGIPASHHVRGELGPDVTAPALLSRLEEALASLGAALGANDVKNIERQLGAALELGASRSQLQQAIETAHTVQENAARIHLHEAERLLDPLAQSVAPAVNEAESGDGCGCGAEQEPKASPVEAEAPNAEAKSNKGSGCRPDDESDTEAASTARSRPAAGFAGPMRGLFGGAGAGETGMAAAMAHCRRMFEPAFGSAAAPADTNEPSAATEAAGSCKKEV